MLDDPSMTPTPITSSSRLRKLEARVADLEKFCIALLVGVMVNVLIIGFVWLEVRRAAP